VLGAGIEGESLGQILAQLLQIEPEGFFPGSGVDLVERLGTPGRIHARLEPVLAVEPSFDTRQHPHQTRLGAVEGLIVGEHLLALGRQHQGQGEKECQEK